MKIGIAFLVIAVLLVVGHVKLWLKGITDEAKSAPTAKEQEKEKNE